MIIACPATGQAIMFFLPDFFPGNPRRLSKWINENSGI